MAGQRKSLDDVSTHSRLKAAANQKLKLLEEVGVSTHSRLKAAANNFLHSEIILSVSTHSRLKAAARCNY